jgi:hypothetical protein
MTLAVLTEDVLCLFQTGCKTKRPNLHITGITESDTLRQSAERYCACMLSSKRTWENEYRRLEVIDYEGHGRKIRSREQRIDIWKYSFVNRTIQLLNQLLIDALVIASFEPSNFTNLECPQSARHPDLWICRPPDHRGGPIAILTSSKYGINPQNYNTNLLFCCICYRQSFTQKTNIIQQ